ncbi:MAG: DUF1186 domain-containing protein [Planctomycetaceae bacterium]|nr:DUF1186 domain-containing protein [Planctomycetaceae bacterium]
MRAAQGMRQEITPLLIECLRDAVRKQRDDDLFEPESNAHFFALMLLWEFRASEALPVLVEALRLPDEGALTLFGDSIFDDVPRALATLGHDRLDVVEGLFLDRSLHHDVRDAAMEASLYLLRDGVYPRERAIEAYLRGLQEASEARNVESATIMVSALADAGPESAMSQIEEAYRNGLVDEWWIALEDVQLSLKQHREGKYHELQDRPPTFLEDAVLDLAPSYAREKSVAGSEPDALDGGTSSDPEMMDALDLDDGWDDDLRAPPPARLKAARIGRNDPCPCGSGKKYKKCCGAAK